MYLWFLLLFFKFGTTICEVTIGLRFRDLVTLRLPKGVTHDAIILSLCVKVNCNISTSWTINNKETTKKKSRVANRHSKQIENN